MGARKETKDYLAHKLKYLSILDAENQRCLLFSFYDVHFFWQNHVFQLWKVKWGGVLTSWILNTQIKVNAQKNCKKLVESKTIMPDLAGVHNQKSNSDF